MQASSKSPLDPDLQGWMRSAEVERAGDYLRRGRTHAALADHDLLDRWKAAFATFVDHLESADHRAAEADLKAELDLRGIPAPMTEVQAALGRLNQRYCDAIMRLAKEDPQRLAELEGCVRSAVATFKQERATRSN